MLFGTEYRDLDNGIKRRLNGAVGVIAKKYDILLGEKYWEVRIDIGNGETYCCGFETKQEAIKHCKLIKANCEILSDKICESMWGWMR